jgi:hypothetical protein
VGDNIGDDIGGVDNLDSCELLWGDSLNFFVSCVIGDDSKNDWDAGDDGIDENDCNTGDDGIDENDCNTGDDGGND